MTEYMEHILATKGHVVVCCAEGAAQDMIQAELERHEGPEPEDESGHPLLHDVGAWLKQKFKAGLKAGPGLGSGSSGSLASASAVLCCFTRPSALALPAGVSSCFNAAVACLGVAVTCDPAPGCCAAPRAALRRT